MENDQIRPLPSRATCLAGFECFLKSFAFQKFCPTDLDFLSKNNFGARIRLLMRHSTMSNKQFRLVHSKKQRFSGNSRGRAPLQCDAYAKAGRRENGPVFPLVTLLPRMKSMETDSTVSAQWTVASELWLLYAARLEGLAENAFCAVDRRSLTMPLAWMTQPLPDGFQVRLNHLRLNSMARSVWLDRDCFLPHRPSRRTSGVRCWRAGWRPTPTSWTPSSALSAPTPTTG